MIYPTVDIDSHAYSVYADQGDADLYLDASISSSGWRAADDVTKARALVSSTRWLDSVLWVGEKTDDAQELQWPRTNVPGEDPDVVPDEIVSGCIELAGALVDNPALRTALKDPLAKSLKAGSASIDYFRPQEVQVLSPFPPIVMSLVGRFLEAGSAAHAGAITSGTDATSDTLDQDFSFTHGF